VEEWGEDRLAMSALWLCAAIIACGRHRNCPEVIEHSQVLLFQDLVQPPRFAKERMQL
jgi:hypothetical protein